MPVEAYKRSDESKANMRFIIDDSRSCHFSLGNDKVLYSPYIHIHIHIRTHNRIFNKGLYIH